MKAFEIKINTLTHEQRSHLAWRLDAKTVCGMITAIHIARCKGEWAEKTLFEVFKFGQLSDHAAKIHSKKVVDFIRN